MVLVVERRCCCLVGALWSSYSCRRPLLLSLAGHNLSDDSTRVLTGAGDNTCRLWDIKSGKCIFVWETRSAVRSVDFGMGGRIALFTTDATMGNTSELNIVEIAEDPAQRMFLIFLYWDIRVKSRRDLPRPSFSFSSQKRPKLFSQSVFPSRKPPLRGGVP